MMWNHTHPHPSYLSMYTLQQKSNSSSFQSPQDVHSAIGIILILIPITLILIPITLGCTLCKRNHTHPHPNHLRTNTLQQESYSSSSNHTHSHPNHLRMYTLQQESHSSSFQSPYSATRVILILIPITLV